MPRKKKVSNKQIIEALFASGGILVEAAQMLNITRQGLYIRIKNDPELQQAKEDAKQQLVDIAEGVLKKKLKEGDTACLLFFLKCQAKGRGYVEKQIIQHDGNISIDVDIKDDEED